MALIIQDQENKASEVFYGMQTGDPFAVWQRSECGLSDPRGVVGHLRRLISGYSLHLHVGHTLVLSLFKLDSKTKVAWFVNPSSVL